MQDKKASPTLDTAEPAPPLDAARQVIGQMRDNATQVNRRSLARRAFLTELNDLSQGITTEVRAIETSSAEGVTTLG